jgi:hypothetical protein
MTQTLVQQFDLKSIPQAGVFVCCGSPKSGKSTMARELVRTLCQRGGADVSRFLWTSSDITAHWPLLISPNTTVTEINYRSVQDALASILLEQSQQKAPRNIVLLLDMNYVPLHEGLLFRAIELNIAVILTACSTFDLSKSQQANVDHIFAFQDTYGRGQNVKKMWDMFFRDWTELDDFKDLFKQLTQDHGCVVYDKSQPKTPRFCKVPPACDRQMIMTTITSDNQEHKTLAKQISPDTLQPGCRVICRTKNDPKGARDFLNSLLTALKPETVIMCTPIVDHRNAIIHGCATKVIVPTETWEETLEYAKRNLVANPEAQTMIFFESSQSEKLPSDLSKLLALSQHNASIVIFSNRGPDNIAGVYYYFKNIMGDGSWLLQNYHDQWRPEKKEIK